MPYGDDWSYTETARVFAQTGYMVYNGWGAPMLGWMIPWAALFIKMFGFSFMAVKLSTLPVAVATLLLFHAVLRRFEITPRNAVIGTLTLGLSPLFLPLSASFMTDIPGLFVLVLCLYLCQRAVAAASDRAAIAWLVAAAVSNVAGGTARQAAWLGVLVMVPCTGWLLRKRRRVFVTAAGLWLVGICAVFYCTHWFSQQPYTVHFRLLPRIKFSFLWLFAFGLYTGNRLEALVLCLLLATFPVLVAWLRQFGTKLDHYLALFCIGLLPLLAMKFFMGDSAQVWPQNLLFAELSTRMVPTWVWPLDLKGTLVPIPIQIAVSMVAIAALFGCLSAVRGNGPNMIRMIGDSRARNIFWLLVPYSMGYFALLFIVIWTGLDYDRYILDLMPCVIAGSIWLRQRLFRANLPRISVFFWLSSPGLRLQEPMIGLLASEHSSRLFVNFVARGYRDPKFRPGSSTMDGPRLWTVGRLIIHRYHGRAENSGRGRRVPVFLLDANICFSLLYPLLIRTIQ